MLFRSGQHPARAPAALRAFARGVALRSFCGRGDLARQSPRDGLLRACRGNRARRFGALRPRRRGRREKERALLSCDYACALVLLRVGAVRACALCRVAALSFARRGRRAHARFASAHAFGFRRDGVGDRYACRLPDGYGSGEKSGVVHADCRRRKNRAAIRARAAFLGNGGGDCRKRLLYDCFFARFVLYCKKNEEEKSC